MCDNQSTASYGEFLTALREYELKTSSKFVCIKSRKSFKEKFTPKENTKINWDGDTPRYYIGCKVYACHQGKDRNLGKKRKYAERRDAREREFHEFKQRRKQSTKKLDCPVHITVSRWLVLSEFKIGKITSYEKTKAAEIIKTKLDKGEEIGGQTVYTFNLPDVTSHQNHPVGLTETETVDHELQSKIKKMFPIGTEFQLIRCKILSEKSCTADVRLKCTSEEAFKEFVKNFEFVQGTTYCAYPVKTRVGQTALYKSIYRCHYNISSTSHKVKESSTNYTGCPAKFAVTIKARNKVNISKDPLVVDYPTVINIRHNHNHDCACAFCNIDVLEPVEYDLVEKVDPFWRIPLLVERNQTNLEVDYQNGFVEMELDTSVNREQPDSGVEKPKWEQMELMMNEITTIFSRKFEESPENFAEALSAMHENIQRLQNDRGLLFSAMHDFGKDMHTEPTIPKKPALGPVLRKEVLITLS